jgi:hypothetical protein
MPTANQAVTLGGSNVPSFIIDSGCNRPLTNNKDILNLYSPLNESVQVADSNATGMQSHGRGGLVFNKSRGIDSIQDVMYCPTASSNLLSVGTLDSGHGDSEGHASVFCDGLYYLLPKHAMRTFWDINKSSSILSGSQQNDGLYYINFMCAPSSATTDKPLPHALQVSQSQVAPETSPLCLHSPAKMPPISSPPSIMLDTSRKPTETSGTVDYSSEQPGAKTTNAKYEWSKNNRYYKTAITAVKTVRTSSPVSTSNYFDILEHLTAETSARVDYSFEQPGAKTTNSRHLQLGQY